jgi:hypothetical protein
MWQITNTHLSAPMDVRERIEPRTTIQFKETSVALSSPTISMNAVRSVVAVELAMRIAADMLKTRSMLCSKSRCMLRPDDPTRPWVGALHPPRVVSRSLVTVVPLRTL